MIAGSHHSPEARAKLSASRARKVIMLKLELEQRFWAKVEPIPEGRGCWEWVGSFQRRGYGSFSVHGTIKPAHRASWEMHNGPIPHGLWVLHKCDNPSCVNPLHLFLGTHVDNMLDMVAKKRGFWARRTHCKNGHAFTESNTRLVTWSARSPRRVCLTCQRDNSNRYAQRIKLQRSNP